MRARVMCVQGPGLLKAAVLRINIQAPTRFSKEEQGVMGDAGKIIEFRGGRGEKRRTGEEHRKQHGRKINGRCLRRFSVALAKTGNGFTQRRRRRNSTFLGKD